MTSMRGWLLFLVLGCGLSACQTLESPKSQTETPSDSKASEPAKTEPAKFPKKPPLPMARSGEPEAEPPTEVKAEVEEKTQAPDPTALTDQQIDQLLNERRITFERAAKLRYREATKAGRVKTKADHTYWSTLIEIYRNWDNRYISWEEVERRLQAAQQAWRGQ